MLHWRTNRDPRALQDRSQRPPQLCDDRPDASDRLYAIKYLASVVIWAMRRRVAPCLILQYFSRFPILGPVITKTRGAWRKAVRSIRRREMTCCGVRKDSGDPVRDHWRLHFPWRLRMKWCGCIWCIQAVQMPHVGGPALDDTGLWAILAVSFRRQCLSATPRQGVRWR